VSQASPSVTAFLRRISNEETSASKAKATKHDEYEHKKKSKPKSDILLLCGSSTVDKYHKSCVSLRSVDNIQKTIA
jgi:hypothetical protein